MLRALSLALVLLSAACSATEVEWERVETPRFVAEDGSYSLELPAGWLRSEHALTREGWEHQTITFNAGPVLEPAEANPIDAAAPELMTAMQDELAAQPGVRVIECRAATFDGLPGFRMHFVRAPAEGAEAGAGEREFLICGAVEDETLYAFSYEARAGADFERDLETFELMLASFERLAPGAASP